MKITDKGLEWVLSLGLLKATESPGIFYLYSWKDVEYYCGLAPSKRRFDKDGVFISLSESQFKSLPISDSKTSTNPKLKQLSSYFQTVVFLSYNAEKDSLKASDYSGQNNNATILEVDLAEPSPFSIAKETRKEFHGFIKPSPKFKDSLEKAYFKTNNLWVTAVPIFTDEKLVGVLAGFSLDKEYGLDVLNVFNGFKPKAA